MNILAVAVKLTLSGNTQLHRCKRKTFLSQPRQKKFVARCWVALAVRFSFFLVRGTLCEMFRLPSIAHMHRRERTMRDRSETSTLPFAFGLSFFGVLCAFLILRSPRLPGAVFPAQQILNMCHPTISFLKFLLRRFCFAFCENYDEFLRLA